MTEKGSTTEGDAVSAVAQTKFFTFFSLPQLPSLEDSKSFPPPIDGYTLMGHPRKKTRPDEKTSCFVCASREEKQCYGLVFAAHGTVVGLWPPFRQQD